MKKLILVSIVLLVFIGCSDKGIIIDPFFGQNYYPGDVVFGLKDSVSLDEFANYIYSLNNIFIGKVSRLRYKTEFPQDSLQIIKSELESKLYIRSDVSKVTFLNDESKILVEFRVKNFGAEDIKDWESLTERFQLQHSPQMFQLGILKVEVGKETEWINYLSNSKLFRFVELNYIMRAN